MNSGNTYAVLSLARAEDVDAAAAEAAVNSTAAGCKPTGLSITAKGTKGATRKLVSKKENKVTKGAVRKLVSKKDTKGTKGAMRSLVSEKDGATGK